MCLRIYMVMVRFGFFGGVLFYMGFVLWVFISFLLVYRLIEDGNK